MFIQSRHKKLRETAALWFSKVQSMSPEDPDRARFESWLMEDSAHQQAYADIEEVWNKLDSTQEVGRLTAVLQGQSHAKRGNNVKSAVKLLSVLLVSFIGYFGFEHWNTQPVMQLTTVADLGEIKTEQLSDGSKITLNAKSNLEVIYYRNQRIVKLKSGEAIFDVAKDESRPFIVDSGSAKVTVLGTRFAVNKLKQMVRISVDHGRVQVEAQNAEGVATGNPLILIHDQVAEVIKQNAPVIVNRNVADGFSFTQGIIVFNRSELPEIAETLSRYRQRPVELDANKAINSRISARLSPKNVETFIDRLPLVAPVTIRHEGNKTVISDQVKNN